MSNNDEPEVFITTGEILYGPITALSPPYTTRRLQTFVMDFFGSKKWDVEDAVVVAFDNGYLTVVRNAPWSGCVHPETNEELPGVLGQTPRNELSVNEDLDATPVLVGYLTCSNDEQELDSMKLILWVSEEFGAEYAVAWLKDGVKAVWKRMPSDGLPDYVRRSHEVPIREAIQLLHA